MTSRARNTDRSGALAVVFDWDDVVFDTAAFKREVARALEKKGVPARETLATFAVAKDDHGYNPFIHGRMLARQGRPTAVAIGRFIWRSCHELADALLFSDAARALRDARASGAPLYVLSAGRRRFQRARIYGSGLESLFRGIYIVDVTGHDAAAATKVKVLSRLAVRHRHLVFLDDRPKTITAVAAAKDLAGKVTPILVCREGDAQVKGVRAIRQVRWKEIEGIGRRGALS